DARALAVRARDGAELPQSRAEGGDVAEHAAVLAGVRHHPRVEALASGARLAPLEEADGIRAVPDVGEGVAHQLPRALRRVHLAPVDGAGGVLHEEPGASLGDVAREVGPEGDVVAAQLTRAQVVVVRDEVDVARPRRVVDVADVLGDHEVGREGDVGGELGQHGGLRPQVVAHGVRGEALEVEALAGVAVGGRRARRQDLLPLRVVLRPEGGAPRLVEGVEGAVPVAQPDASARPGQRRTGRERTAHPPVRPRLRPRRPGRQAERDLPPPRHQLGIHDRLAGPPGAPRQRAAREPPHRPSQHPHRADRTGRGGGRRPRRRLREPRGRGHPQARPVGAGRRAELPGRRDRRRRRDRRIGRLARLRVDVIHGHPHR
ncbi:hypothetical protein FF38_11589, partial [Lucilia cuprina]